MCEQNASSSNKFLREVRDGEGIGLEYETMSGHRGIIWLVRPAGDASEGSPQLTIFGGYLLSEGLQHRGQQVSTILQS